MLILTLTATGYLFCIDTLLPPVYGRYELEFSKIVVNSVSVFPADIEFSVDYSEACLFFPRIASESVFVSYLPISYLADSLYRAYSPVAAEEGSGYSFGEFPGNTENSDNLSIGGEKSFGFGWTESGKGEIRQDLALNFRGLISEYWKVGGYIHSGKSGEALPVGDLEKIYITLESPVMRAYIGDIEESQEVGICGNLSGDILGVKGELTLSENYLMGSFGEIKNETMIKIIEAVFGMQGPYPILESNENRNFVPGSEKVFLNGIQISSEEYRIEITDGAQIIFSPDVRLSDEDKIMVFCKVSGNSFRRMIHFVSSGTGRNGFFLNFSRAGYSDIKDAPFGFALSERAIEILESLGDSARQGLVDAGIFVGVGRGSYDSEEGIYVFRGYGKGSYDVSFMRVDSGMGEYVYDGSLPGFRYAGAEKGDYLAKISVEPAQTRTAEIFGAGFNSDIFALEITGARSYADKNLFSPRDDQDNEGFGAGGNFSFRRGSFSIFGEGASIGKRFSALDDYGGKKPVEYFSSVLSPGGRWVFLSFRGAGYEKLTLEGNSGFLTNLDFRKERADISITWGDERRYLSFITAYQRGDSTSAAGNLSKKDEWMSLKGGLEFSFIRPEFALTRQTSEDTVHSSTDKVFSMWTVFLGENLSFSAHGFTSRLSVETEGEREVYMTLNEVGFKSAFRGKGCSFSLFLSKKTEIPGKFNPRSEQSFYLGKSEISIFSSGAVVFNAEYSLSRTRYFTRMEVFEEVAEGKGNFSYDSVAKIYYPDPYGRYVRFWVETGSSEPVNDASFYAFFSPFFGGISFRFALKAREINKSENSQATAFFYPGHTMNRINTLKGARFFSAGARKGLTENSETWISARREINLNSEQEGDALKDAWMIMIGYAYDEKVRLETESSYGESSFEKVSENDSYYCNQISARILGALEIGSWEPRIVVTAVVKKFNGFIDYPLLGPFVFRKTDISAGASLSGNIRLDGSFGLTYNNYTSSFAPAELRAIDFPGYVLHWNLSSDIMASGNLSFLASYSGEKRIDEKTYQRLSLGIKLLF
ncbi:hypothetical protein JW890_00015 [candidate division WOR-3 bacterium]|nr:hypothetical protein [candidate division WOR-3 bacterium]